MWKFLRDTAPAWFTVLVIVLALWLFIGAGWTCKDETPVNQAGDCRHHLHDFKGGRCLCRL